MCIMFMQEDIEEVSRVARQVKNRLERLDKINEQSLSRKVRLLKQYLPRQAPISSLRMPILLLAAQHQHRLQTHRAPMLVSIT